MRALGEDVTTFCAARLARVAGTHGLVLDGLLLDESSISEPAVAGVACWSRLHPLAGKSFWTGSLSTELAELPFADDAFCAVLLRFAEAMQPPLAAELARVLAPHGKLLIAGFHPRSGWRRGVAPGRWERALRTAGLDVVPAKRCGAPWPRPRGASGLPHWLVGSMGGAWVIEARRNVLASLSLRRAAANRRAVEHNALLPGAHRQCA